MSVISSEHKYYLVIKQIVQIKVQTIIKYDSVVIDTGKL